jgi:HEPN domain-containing protein
MDMNSEKVDWSELKEFWLMEAEESLRVAEHLFEKGDYSYALFFGHLAVEKILKALYVIRVKTHAPPIHNLVRLARGAGLVLDDRHTRALVTITGFNIEARYPDVKRAFREKCTHEYTEQQVAMIKESFEWIRSQLPR